jgi:signal transduction histidine kinase/DNA-binding response OmpR family regulator
MGLVALLRIVLRHEHDVVLARQRARALAAVLGLDRSDQTRLGTAVSEIARNAVLYAGQGSVEFFLEDAEDGQFLMARVADQGPGIADLSAILEGRYQSPTGLGAGLAGTARIMSRFAVRTAPGQGTEVRFGKRLPTPLSEQEATSRLARLTRETPEGPLEEIQRQNQELLQALEELEQQSQALAAMNRELEETNRGVMALYTELEEKARSLEQANALVRRFLSHLSHEFRTPLNSILGLARLLLDRTDGDLTSEQAKQVGFIQSSARSLLDMVNELLDFARIEAGKETVQVAPFSVGEFLSGLRGMFRPLVEVSRVELVVDLPEPDIVMESDEPKVTQIVRNFLANAVKFTTQGSIRVGTQRKGGLVRFFVADTGVGIPPEEQERIFEEYAQVAGEHQRYHKGTGLGLPVAKRLAELLGGRVWVESAVGEGSTFWVELPMRSGEGGKGPLPVVLVVEDEDSVFYLYEKQGADLPVRWERVRGVHAAQRFLEEQTPSAMIVDLLLEDGNGLELIAWCRTQPHLQEVPIFVATVLSQELERAKEQGATDAVAKPVPPDWIKKRLTGLRGEDGDRPVVVSIDDEPSARYLVRRLLQDTGYALLEASSGEEGLALVRQVHPQFVFLDLNMPGMSGREVLARIKADPATAKTLVIILTSQSLSEAEVAALQQAAAVLSKEAIFHSQEGARTVATFLRHLTSGGN